MYSVAKEKMLQNVAFFRGAFDPKVKELCDKKSITDYSNCLTHDYDYYSRAVRSTCDEIFTYCSWNNVEFDCCDKIKPVGSVFGQCFTSSGISAPFNVSPSNFVLSKQFDPVGNLHVEVKTRDVMVFATGTGETFIHKDHKKILLHSEETLFERDIIHDVYLSVTVSTKFGFCTYVFSAYIRFSEKKNIK